MELVTLGLFVQASGVGLLAAIFLYISRQNRDQVLQAMGCAWLLLFMALLSHVAVIQVEAPFVNFLYQYLKFLYFVALVVAANRMSRDSALAWPLGIAALIALPVSFAIVLLTHTDSLFHAVEMGIGVFAWMLAAILVLRSQVKGLGKALCALFAFLTAFTHVAYVALFAGSAVRNRPLPALAYFGFCDLFLEMLFGLSLIIWAMEGTEWKLARVHAQTRDHTLRSLRKAVRDPLTETYNRLFLDENRPALSRDPAGGSIVLIDVNGLKSINDREGHEEGDKAIWTVATAIKQLIRGDDYVIRWGGDEFLVVLPGMDERAAKRRFYTLQAKIEEVRQSSRHENRVYKKFLSASVGVTPYSRRVPFDTAIEVADRAMYERKKAYKQALEAALESPRITETPGSPLDKPN
jgi:diguanylate cyclase (GGDEF)-like protein